MSSLISRGGRPIAVLLDNLNDLRLSNQGFSGKVWGWMIGAIAMAVGHNGPPRQRQYPPMLVGDFVSGSAYLGAEIVCCHDPSSPQLRFKIRFGQLPNGCAFLLDVTAMGDISPNSLPDVQLDFEDSPGNWRGSPVNINNLPAELWPQLRAYVVEVRQAILAFDSQKAA